MVAHAAAYVTASIDQKHPASPDLRSTPTRTNLLVKVTASPTPTQMSRVWSSEALFRGLGEVQSRTFVRIRTANESMPRMICPKDKVARGRKTMCNLAAANSTSLRNDISEDSSTSRAKLEGPDLSHFLNKPASPKDTRRNILGLTFEDLENDFTSKGLSKFRTKQVYFIYFFS